MGTSAKLLSPTEQIVEHVAYANLAAITQASSPPPAAPHSIGAEHGSRGGCLAISTDGSVERRVEVGDAGLRVVVEGAIVATEWGGTEHTHDGAEADTVEKAGVIGREVIVEPLYVHADEDAAAGTHPLGADDGAPLLLGACDKEEGLRLHLH